MATTNETSMGGNAHTSTQAGQEHLQGLQEDTHGDAENVTQQGGAPFEHYRDSAAHQIENLAQNAQSAAQQMEGNDTLGLSRYVTELAQNMTSLAENLRSKSAEQLLQDAGKLARDNPVLFFSGSVALGLGLSRLLKAATPNIDSPTATPASTSFADTSTDSSLASVDASGASRPISPSTLAAEEVAAPPPLDHDVLHSARPGKDLPDSPPITDVNDDLDDDLSEQDPPRPGSTTGGA